MLDESKPKSKCRACGILFVPKPCTKGLYCDRRCKNLGQVKRKTRKCAACGKPLRRSAAECRRTKTSVCDRACQTKAKDIPLESVAELRARGLSFVEIGKALGCKRNKANYLFKRYQKAHP